MLSSLTPTGMYICSLLRCRILSRGIIVFYLLVSPDGRQYDLILLSFRRKVLEYARFPDVSRNKAEARRLFRTIVRGKVTPYAADEVIDALLSFPDKI